MALLPAPAREAAWQELMQLESRDSTPLSLTKQDLRAALDAADAWADAAASSFNSAIPQPARAQLSAKSKARLLAIVLQYRYGTEL